MRTQGRIGAIALAFLTATSACTRSRPSSPPEAEAEPASEQLAVGVAEPAAASPSLEPSPPPADEATGPAPVDDPVAQSTFILLLAARASRPLPYADAALDLFATLPDYSLLIDAGGLDVLHDFDHILAATPDFRDFRRTFLVGEYTLAKADMKAALERAVHRSGQTIDWVEHEGFVGGNPVPSNAGEPDRDPRWFVLLPNEKIGVYVPPEYLGSIVPQGEGAPTLDHVGTLRRLVEQRPDACLQFAVTDVWKRLAGWSLPVAGLPLHSLDEIRVVVEASPTPDFMLTLRFLDDASAEMMERFWRREAPVLVDHLDLPVRLFVAPLLDQTLVERHGLELTARVRLTEPQIAWIVGMVSVAALKVSSKTPADIERLRKQRQENWARRRGGKRPPAALGPG